MPAYTFAELVDIEKFEESMAYFHKATNLLQAILDPEGNILTSVGWVDICTKFHRSNPLTSARCQESDLYINSHLHEGEYSAYKCKNGLQDIAFPIFIDGEHLATFFFGQFFYDDEEPDIEFFRKQAEEAGFDEDEYLDALARAPRLSREKVLSIISYYRILADMLTETGLSNLKLKKEIKDRERAEKALQEASDIINLSPAVAFLWKNKQGWPVEFVSGNVENILGFTSEEFTTSKVFYADIIHEDDIETVTEEVSRYSSDASCFQFNHTPYRIVTKNGEIKWIDDRTYIRRNSEGIITHFHGIVLDITNRINTTEQLQKEKIFTDRVLEAMNDTVFLFDPSSGKALRWNKAFEEVSQYSHQEISSLSAPASYFSDEDLNLAVKTMKQVMEEGKATVQLSLIDKNGKTVDFEYSVSRIDSPEGTPLTLSVGRNITERKQLDEERSKASKLESIGILAGGIAHDFNNILAALLGNISLAKQDIYKKETLELLTEAEQASFRAKDLTQQLLTFSKGGSPVTKTTLINELLEQTIRFSLRGSNVDYQVSIPSDLWPVDVDKGQIAQVINNLILNAKQAMPEGGTVTVIAENTTEVPQEYFPANIDKFIRISIVDTGSGISEQQLPKIFDPYFSTKQTGSGLGLATSYSIIKKHGGHINVTSAIGHGTTFTIYLPASYKSIDDDKHSLPFPQDATGKILLMDDDDAVRKIVNKMLTRLGNEVELTRDGTETIAVYKKAMDSGKPFDLVILDLTIPGGMGGKQAIQKLLEIDPDICAVVSSGYSNDPVVSQYEKYGFRDTISKPYKLDEIRNIVRKLITNCGPLD